MQIQVMGSGCTTCKNLFELTKQAISELKLNAEVEYVTDINKIIELGVMTTPVLVINRKVAMTGFSNDINRLKELITAEIKE